MICAKYLHDADLAEIVANMRLLGQPLLTRRDDGVSVASSKWVRAHFKRQRVWRSRRHRTLPGYVPRDTSEVMPAPWSGSPAPYPFPTITVSPHSSGEFRSTWLVNVPIEQLFGEVDQEDSEESLGIHVVKGPVVAKTQGYFSYRSVEKALKKTRVDFAMKAALIEVVFGRQSPPEISRAYTVPLANLERYATRLREKLRAQMAV